MPELGTAWITIAANTKGMEKDIRKALDDVQGAEPAGRKAGSGFGSGFSGAAGTAMKAGMVTAVAGAATVAAVAIAGVVKTLSAGFDRLKSIDTATTKLKALGNNSAAVAKIMDSALKSVKGTSFGLEEGATAAAMAVAAGIKPGKDLTAYLTSVADTAAVAGTSMAEMGTIFGKVQTSGRADTEVLNQLADRGIPIWQYLSKVTGKAGEDLRKFVEKGGVDAATFNRAIQTNIGGAAAIMGQSFEGSVANMKAAWARLGAAFLKPVFGNFAGGVGSITTALDSLTAWVEQHQAQIIDFFVGLGNAAITFGEMMVNGVGTALKSFGELAGGIGNVYGTMQRTQAALQRLTAMPGSGGDAQRAYADELDRSADAAFGWGEALKAAGDKLAGVNFRDARAQLNAWGDSAKAAARDAESASGAVSGLGTAVGALPFSKDIKISADTTEADAKMRAFIDTWSNAIITPTVQVPGQTVPGTNPLDALAARPSVGGGRAGGGSIIGAGSGRSDSILALLSNGEHVWSADEVRKAGGQDAMYRLRAAVRRFAGGGAAGYGLPFASNSGGYGGAGTVFPDWVNQIATYFGIKPSTYSGHQATNRNEAGYAPNPQGLNRGIDWSGPPANMQRFADYLATIPQDLEQVIWPGALEGTGATVEIAGGKPQPGYFAGDLAGHAGANAHVHTRQSMKLPLPGQAATAVTGAGNATGLNLTQLYADSLGEGGKDAAGKIKDNPQAGGIGGMDASSLMDSIMGGVLQSTGFDGTVFSNPMEWPNVKSLMAGLKFGMGMLKGAVGGPSGSTLTQPGGELDTSGGLGGGAGLPNVASLMKPIGAGATTPNVDTSRIGTGASPAVVVNGDVGMDPRAFTQRVDAAQNQSWRRNMAAVRP